MRQILRSSVRIVCGGDTMDALMRNSARRGNRRASKLGRHGRARGKWLPSLFLFVFGHEIHENPFRHFLMGGEGYFGSVLSFKTNTHRLRNLLFGLELNVMPFWFTHAHSPLRFGILLRASYCAYCKTEVNADELRPQVIPPRPGAPAACRIITVILLGHTQECGDRPGVYWARREAKRRIPDCANPRRER
jgi:hypothetical protein